MTVIRWIAGMLAALLMLTGCAFAEQAMDRELPQGVSARAVTLFAGSDCELHGELVIPENADEHTPYVVFAHGSGPSDMDESIGANKPFRDLAYDLAVLGVGSLRHDKITFVHPYLPYETVDQEYLEPVTEALRVLKEETGAARAYLIGHSEGGMIMPYLVDACGFDGGVALAGTPLNLWEISYAQNLELLSLLPPEYSAQQLPLIEAERERALGLADMSEEEARASTVFGMHALYLRHMALMDQAQIAKESGKPYLFLWGDRDFQVSREAFDAWQTRLGDGPRYAYRVYEGLNHLFMPAGENDSILNAMEAYREPKCVAAQVSSDIAAWIADQR